MRRASTLIVVCLAGFAHSFFSRSPTALALPASFPGCVPTNQGKDTSAYLIPMLIFQSTVCVLAVIKSVQTAAGEYNTPKVMVVLLRDSATYFGSILSVLIVNIVIFTAARVRRICLSVRPLPNDSFAVQASLVAVALG